MAPASLRSHRTESAEKNRRQDCRVCVPGCPPGTRCFPPSVSRLCPQHGSSLGHKTPPTTGPTRCCSGSPLAEEALPSVSLAPAGSSRPCPKPIRGKITTTGLLYSFGLSSRRAAHPWPCGWSGPGLHADDRRPWADGGGSDETVVGDVIREMGEGTDDVGSCRTLG